MRSSSRSARVMRGVQDVAEARIELLGSTGKVQS
jgi:hypothetical protein